MLSSARSKDERSRSSLLTTKMQGRFISSAYCQTFSVETSTPATPSTTMMAASAAIMDDWASGRKMLKPGVSMMLSFVFCHGQAATAEEMVILRATSSSSKSVMVLPSSTLRCRSVAPAVKSIAEARDVFPLCPCPMRATVLISDVSKTFIYCLNLQRRNTLANSG